MPTVIGLMADPGAPEQLAHAIAGSFGDASPWPSADGRAEERADEDGVRLVSVARETLPLTDTSTIPIFRHAERLRERHGWDYLVYLTDLPLWQDSRPMLCEVRQEHRAALVCVPALGGIRWRSRARRVVEHLMEVLESNERISPERMGGKLGSRISENGEEQRVLLTGRLGHIRLLAGMVRSNRPLRLFSAMWNTVAAAVAAGAFGIFYASIWNMADALSMTRLAFISLLAIATLCTWLITHNGLWDRSTTESLSTGRKRDNLSTVLTVGTAVVLMYLFLHALLFVGSLIVIAVPYLESRLQHPANLADYVRLSWLAASLGTLAGAIGSNFDEEGAIREATYRRREHHRRGMDPQSPST